MSKREQALIAAWIARWTEAVLAQIGTRTLIVPESSQLGQLFREQRQVIREQRRKV